MFDWLREKSDAWKWTESWKTGEWKNWDCTITTNSLTADSNIPQCKSFKVLPRVPRFKDIFFKQVGKKMGSNMGVREKGAFKRWTGTERKFYATCSYLMVSQFVWSSLIRSFPYTPKHGAHRSQERTLFRYITGG